jgi:hypothetical protein
MVTNQQADIVELGAGTRNFVYQFKPLAMTRNNAKNLLIDDHDYSTPQDHYFSYINKRQQTGVRGDENKILEDLGLQEFMTELNKSTILDLEEEVDYEALTLMKPKHTKKDYESITKLGVGKILDIATVAPKKQEFVEDK